MRRRTLPAPTGRVLNSIHLPIGPNSALWPCSLPLTHGCSLLMPTSGQRPMLAAEVRRVIDSDACAGYWVPRRNYIFGHLMSHTGWSPDYQPRLLNVARCRWDPAHPVHELVIFDGPDGRLHNTLTHYNYDKSGPVHRQARTLHRHCCPAAASARANGRACGHSSASRHVSSTAVSSAYRATVTESMACSSASCSPTTNCALMSNCGGMHEPTASHRAAQE